MRLAILSSAVLAALAIPSSPSPSSPVPSTPAPPATEEEDLFARYPARFLPADVLRDFPNLCFGSTALRLFQVGQSWSLRPFCGVATCLEQNGVFYERVKDCGPKVKPNPQCELLNPNSEADYPACCPKYKCAEGVEVEYFTPEELQAELEEQEKLELAQLEAAAKGEQVGA